MTKEQLARWRELGFEFDDFYDTVAVDPPKKSLTITYVSSTQDEENYYLKFVIKTQQLQKDKGDIILKEINRVFSDTPLYGDARYITVTPNGTSTYVMKIAKKSIKNLDTTGEVDGFEFKAFFTCDELVAETKEFKINTEKKKVEKEVEKEVCYCDRNFTVEEFKSIVVELRKQEIYIENGRLIKDAKGKPILENQKKQFENISMYDEIGEKLFYIDKTEKIRSKDTNFTKFTEAINKTLKDYEINTCIRKIHFLAQCYHETQRFTLTYETNPNISNISGGEFYRGRGLIQLTHDYNYKNLQKKINDKSNLIDFVPRVAKEINLACQASGYYWRYLGVLKGNINIIADEDDILTISKEINGYGGKNGIPNGFNDRKIFTKLLKNIFNYEKCKKNK